MKATAIWVPYLNKVEPAVKLEMVQNQEDSENSS